MAWVSPKVYAILSKSEEGKDIIERLPDLTQDEASQEIDAFFGEGGKGFSSGEEYNQAKFDDEAEEERYKALGDEEVSEKDYVDEPKGEVTEEEISEALADYEWQITDSTTVGQYAQETADKLGCSKEQVLKVIRNEDPNIKEDERMAKIAGLDDGQEVEEELKWKEHGSEDYKEDKFYVFNNAEGKYIECDTIEEAKETLGKAINGDRTLIYSGSIGVSKYAGDHFEDITRETENMSEEELSEDKYKQHIFDNRLQDNESGELGKQLIKNTNYYELLERHFAGHFGGDNPLSEDEEETFNELSARLETFSDISNAESEEAEAQKIIEKSNYTIKRLKQKIENGDASKWDKYDYNRAIYKKQAAETVLENLKEE